MRNIIYSFIILLFLNKVNSQTYTNSNIPFQNFGLVGAGSSSSLTISNNSIQLVIGSSGFSATQIPNKLFVSFEDYTGNVPNMILGYITGSNNGLPVNVYKIVVLNKKLYIYSDNNLTVSQKTLNSISSSTLLSSLTTYNALSSQDIQEINSLSENFIREITYTKENGDANGRKIQTTFYDGLGRPKQNVLNKQSNDLKNIVIPIVYDQYGREYKDYLPYKSNNDGLGIEVSAENDAINYYTNSTNVSENSNIPFSEKFLENSPLNRVLKQSAPGSTWSMGSGHEIKFEYETNVAIGTNAVKFFSANATWNGSNNSYEISLLQNGSTNYLANELYVFITKNENWTSGKNNTTEEFKNKEGKIVLKRAYDNDIAHDTYYVYDQYGNLTFVIPPKADAAITTTVLDELCYQYKYDSKNRLIEKKIPGKQWEFIVYDKLDRVVATGPTLSPFSDLAGTYGWLITKYDAFGRIAYTGWENSASTSVIRASKQALQNGLTTISEVKQTSGTIDGINAYYSNNVLPTSFKLLTINYYDDYVFPDAPTIPTAVEGQAVYYNNTIKPKGMTTGIWERIIKTTTLTEGETKWMLYDIKSRTIRTYSKNNLGGFTQIDNKLEAMTGRVNYRITTHSRNTTTATLTVREDFTYNSQDKIVTHTHTINGGTPQLLAENIYSELGQLISKKVGNTSTDPLQKVDYKYNIRGWLTAINDVTNLTQASNPVDLFAFKINYNTVENITNYNGTPLYNGNISETFWRTNNDNTLRKYGYSYDGLNRLKNAVYQKPESSTPVTNSYNESITYDKNGNIMTLQRNGDFDDPLIVLQIDNLAYNYGLNNGTNRLMKITDSTNSTIGFKDDSDGTNDTTDDYSYDLNGNMTKDDNKGISSIKYNHLNLPIEINFSGTTTKKISYIYTSSGQKIRKEVYSGGSVIATDYLDGFQYQQTNTGSVKLLFFPHAEGYVNNTVTGGMDNYNYVFNYVDHLGNVRMSYSKDPASSTTKILEENNYYPFGLKHNNYNWDKEFYDAVTTGILIIKKATSLPYKYKLNGKEYQEDLGLNVYAFGWRDYDPAIGRFTKIDRFAEKYYKLTPYSYAGNNPVLINDIQGDSLWINHKGNKYLYEYNKKNGGQLYTVSKGQKTLYTGKVNGFLGKSFDALNALNNNSNTANDILGYIQSSDLNLTISHSSNNPNGNKNEFIEDNKYNSYAFTRLLTGQGLSSVTNIGSGGTVYWDPNAGSVWELNNPNQVTNPTTNLFHELVHGWDSANGNLNDTDYNQTGLSVMEYRAVFYENQARIEIGANKREYYKSSLDLSTGIKTPYPPRTLDSNNIPIYVTPPSIYFLMK